MQELEENLRETQATAQRTETHLEQKKKLYEDKIKVRLLLVTNINDVQQSGLPPSLSLHRTDIL